MNINIVDEKIINEEKLVFLCSEICSAYPSDSEFYDIASLVIVAKAIKNLHQKNNNDDYMEFTEKEIQDETGVIIADHVLSQLVKKGFLECSFDEDSEDFSFKASEMGKEFVDNLYKQEDDI